MSERGVVRCLVCFEIVALDVHTTQPRKFILAEINRYENLGAHLYGVSSLLPRSGRSGNNPLSLPGEKELLLTLLWSSKYLCTNLLLSSPPCLCSQETMLEGFQQMVINFYQEPCWRTRLASSCTKDLLSSYSWLSQVPLLLPKFPANTMFYSQRNEIFFMRIEYLS